jgi:hypothetical protein
MTEQKIIEEVAYLLAKLGSEEQVRSVSHEAEGMAIRAKREWWEIPGRPEYNKAMQRLKRRLT